MPSTRQRDTDLCAVATMMLADRISEKSTPSSLCRGDGATDVRPAATNLGCFAAFDKPIIIASLVRKSDPNAAPFAAVEFAESL
jgi:hypothetical protein